MRKWLTVMWLIASGGGAIAAETINYDTIGCISEDDFSKAGDLGRSGDEAAWKKFVMQKVTQGQCTLLKKGDEVFLEDFSMFSGVACVRPKGETECVFIEYEAIQGS